MNNLIENVSDLLKRIPNIDSFEEVSKWDSEAKDKIESLNEVIGKLNSEKERLQRELNTIRANYNALPFFKKIFYSKKPELALNSKIIDIDEAIEKSKLCIDKLEEWIEKTPDNKAEAELMLKELKLMKKELTTAKKEVAAEIRDINNQTRTKNANVSNQIFSSSKVRQIQKIGIRIEKEQALNPRQDQKAQIEAEIIQVEKMINWIEKIKM